MIFSKGRIAAPCAAEMGCYLTEDHNSFVELKDVLIVKCGVPFKEAVFTYQ